MSSMRSTKQLALGLLALTGLLAAQVTTGPSSNGATHPTSTSAGTMAIAAGTGVGAISFDTAFVQTDAAFVVKYTANTAIVSGGALVAVTFGASWGAPLPICSFQYTGGAGTPGLFQYQPDSSHIYITAGPGGVPAGAYEVAVQCRQ